MKTNQKSQNECENTVTHEDRNRHRNTRDKRKDKMNRWHTGVHRKNGGKTVKDRKWEVKHDTRINLQNETGNSCNSQKVSDRVSHTFILWQHSDLLFFRTHGLVFPTH